MSIKDIYEGKVAGIKTIVETVAEVAVRAAKVAVITAMVAGVGAVEAQAAEAGNLSVFEPVEVGKNAARTKKMLSLEALWEVDVNSSRNGEFKDEAYENDFRVFAVDGIVYAYTECYVSDSKSTWRLRRFDASTGEELEPFAGECPSFSNDNPGYDKEKLTSQFSFLADEKGNVLMMVLSTPTNKGQGRIVMEAFLLNKADGSLATQPCFIYEGASAAEADVIVKGAEWSDLKGNVPTGNFSVVLSGRHHFGDSWGTDHFYPTRFEFVFANGELSQTKITRFANGPLQTYDVTTGQVGMRGRIASTDLGDGYYLMQLFGSSNAANDHSPVILYKDEGDTDDRKLRNPAPLLTQKELLDQSGLKFVDQQCFGAWPLRLGDQTLLVLPSKCNDTDGAIFNIARWPDATTFADMQAIWQLPNGAKYPAVAGQTFYYRHPAFFEVPAVASEPSQDAPLFAGTTTVSKDFYVYMPGAILGKYRASYSTPTASGQTTIVDDFASTSPDWHLDGRTLVVNSASTPVSVYTVEGVKIAARATTSPLSIDLSAQPSGLYLLRIGNATFKLLLR